jgi:hypothetical protein
MLFIPAEVVMLVYMEVASAVNSRALGGSTICLRSSKMEKEF